MTPTTAPLRTCARTLSALWLTALTASAQDCDPLLKVLANDATESSRLGSAVATSGRTAIVGAELESSYSTFGGAVYLFDLRTGLQTAKLFPPVLGFGDRFGSAVGISGTLAIVGAHRDDDFGTSSGSAYLIDLETGVQTKLVASDGDTTDWFGFAVAIDGTTAVVGAHQNDDLGPDSGSAYLFDVATGLETAKLLPDDGDLFDMFGYSVAVTGTTAIVGAYNEMSVGGAVYLFDTTTGQQTAKLAHPRSGSGDQFGYSVAVEGSLLIVGAPNAKFGVERSGAAHLFDLNTGAALALLVPTDGEAGDRFGHSVGIRGSVAVVGAPHDQDYGLESGSIYLFDTTTGAQLEKVVPEDGHQDARFGHAVAMGETGAIAGAQKDDEAGNNAGALYLWRDLPFPALTGDVDAVSLSTGGRQLLVLDGCTSRANWPYFMFGSVTGTAPGIDFGGGVVLPLNFDVYFDLILRNPSFGAFGKFVGTLDPGGRGLATLTIPQLGDPTLVGVVLHHAFVAGSVLGSVEFASNALPVTLDP